MPALSASYGFSGLDFVLGTTIFCISRDEKAECG